MAALAGALRRTRAPWMIIGGIAVIARGVRRLTTDIDVVVRGDSVNQTPLLQALAGSGIVPRIVDAEAFARQNLVLLLRHEPSGVDIDLSFGWTVFEREAISASTATRYGAASLPTARPEDLIIYKAMAARPKDMEDAAALLLMYPEIDLNRVRRRLTELAALADEPELARGIDQLVIHARSVRHTAIKRAPAGEKPERRSSQVKNRAPRKKK